MKKVFTVCMIAALFVGMQSCSDDNDEPKNKNSFPTTPEIVLTQSETLGNTGTNKFAFDIFKTAASFYDETSGSNGNYCVSPFSATIALAMIANSTDGEVSQNIVQTLGYASLADFNSASHKLIQFIPDLSNGADILINNSVWYDDAYTISTDYSNTLYNNFYSSVSALDFSSEDAVDVINSWVAKNTENLITDIVQDVSKQSVLVANALYFYGQWATPFSNENTIERTFTSSKDKKGVPMMHRTYSGEYADTEEFSAIFLPFQNDEMTMTFVLPKENVDIFASSQSFDYEKWSTLDGAKQKGTIALKLPRFKVLTDCSLSLILKRLGIDTSSCNLSPMGINEEHGLETYQKTYLRVEESGARAAAVTYTGDYISKQEPEGQVYEIAFDRPFMYFITNNTTGTVLMAGRLCNL